MAEPIRFWTGDEWQAHINRLLRRRYADPGGYQELPARDGGDLGLEGFSHDGICFQCYAAEEPLSTADLYEKQRDKMTADIAKFIGNKIKLSGIFANLKIRRWLLVVPRFESTRLLAHAGIKTQQVLDAALSYVTPDFTVGVITDAEFEVEFRELTRVGVYVHDFLVSEPQPEDVQEFLSSIQSSALQQNIERKVVMFPKLSTNDARARFTDHIVKHYLRGQSVLSGLRERDPEQFENYLKLKKLKENTLVTETLVQIGTPTVISTTLQVFKTEVERQLSVSPNTAELLAWESVSDWLMRCL